MKEEIKKRIEELENDKDERIEEYREYHDINYKLEILNKFYEAMYK
jgi:hypothetical protein